MTDQLQALYRVRADRAPDLDTDALLADVVRAAGHDRRRRRSALAAGAGVAGIAAAAAVILALTSGDGGSTDSAPPAASHSSASASASASASRAARAEADRAAAQRIVDRARAAAAQQAARAAAATLDHLPAAPAAAPLSLGLAPSGFRFLAFNEATATYGPADAPDPTSSGSFTGKIAVMVSRPVQPESADPFPLTLGGHPARYTSDGGVSQVVLWLSDDLQIDVQFWSNLDISEPQALAIGGAVDIRDTSHPAVG